MRTAILLTLFSLFSGAAYAMEKSEIEQLFLEANTAFYEASQIKDTDPERAKELYNRALLRYQSLKSDANIENGKLYYNIANTYFYLNDLGRAIVNYRRAIILAPTDSNILQNLNYARSEQQDNISLKAKSGFMRTIVLFWHYDFNRSTRMLIFYICFSLVWLFATISLYIRRVLGWPILIFVFLSCLYAGSLFVESYTQKQTGVVIAHKVIARKAAAPSAARAFDGDLHAGLEFAVIEERGEWLHIKLADDRTCWLPSNAVELV